MKKIICMILIFSICCGCLYACGSVKLTESDIENALDDFDGILTTTGNPENITSFTYKFEDIDTETITDRYAMKEIALTGLDDMGKLTFNEFTLVKVFVSTLSIINLLEKDESSEKAFDVRKVIDDVISIISDGTEYNSNGWSIQANVDDAAGSVEILVNKG